MKNSIKSFTVSRKFQALKPVKRSVVAAFSGKFHSFKKYRNIEILSFLYRIQYRGGKGGHAKKVKLLKLSAESLTGLDFEQFYGLKLFETGETTSPDNTLTTIIT